MNRSGYQVLGFVVWKGAKWYAHRRLGVFASRRFAAGVLVTVLVAGLAIAGRRASAA